MPSRRQAVAIIIGIAVIFTSLLVRYAGQQTTRARGSVTTAENIVILEPKQWIGQKLPIAGSIDLDLSNGKWTVLLHRHDCPACQQVLPQYERRAATGERIDLVEVPPYGDFGPRKKACHYDQLKEDHEWFVHTPVEIRLQSGLVTAVKMHDH